MITCVIIVLLFVSLYLHVTKIFNYWEARGIKYDKPIPFFGNNFKGYFLQKSITEMATDIYWKYPNEKAVGFFRGSRPELVIRDPEIVKRILLEDFINFYDRGINPNKKVTEPLLHNLFYADGDLWRLMRQRMTPAFTSGKLKAMFPLIVERAVRLQARTLTAAAAGCPIDARDLMARYTTDFIGACGFGLDPDSLNDDHSTFRKLGARIFHVDFRAAVIFVLKEMFPEPFKHFRLFSRIEDEIKSFVTNVLKQRNYEPSGRNDFIDLMLECKKQGSMVGESLERVGVDGKPEITTLEFTDELIAAQVFVFFAAGFETSSSATSYTLHELAYHPEVQKKVQQDIDRVLAKYGNKFSYDAIKEMNYLECAFKEGMRMFPSLGYLVRKSTRKCIIPELNTNIGDGVAIIIPLQALHNDPKYFENPEEFRPDRFMPDEMKRSNKYVYLPFGDGPRNCIGQRLGLMQSMAGLAAILARFTVEPAPQTKRRPRVDPHANIVQVVRGGLPLLFRERSNYITEINK